MRKTIRFKNCYVNILYFTYNEQTNNKEITTRQLPAEYTVTSNPNSNTRPTPNTTINTFAKKHVIMQTKKERPRTTA